MKLYYAIIMTILITIFTTCESPGENKPPKLPCDEVLDRVAECIGARPAIRGMCTLSTARYLLSLSCNELIDALGVP
jgi:predicted secreted protein